MREGNPLQLTGIPQRRPQENDAIPKIAPKWLKYDRQVSTSSLFNLYYILINFIHKQVLQFDAYFQEAVVENANENFRIRNCIVYYYLEDDTLHIIEKRLENSGIPQGIFLKRHKVPKPDITPPQYYTWQDLNLRMNLELYGRVFRIVDCDQFTRMFFANEGCALLPAE